MTLDMKNDNVSQIATSGCISALLSNNQNALLETCRVVPGDKFDWNDARSFRFPFWIRSDDKLKKMSEEIGQAIFRKTKDVMECAIYFIIAGNMRMLRNLAATDQHQSGRKFMKFITDPKMNGDEGLPKRTPIVCCENTNITLLLHFFSWPSLL